MGEITTKLRALAIRLDKIERDLEDKDYDAWTDLDDELSIFEASLDRAEEALKDSASEDEDDEDDEDDEEEAEEA